MRSSIRRLSFGLALALGACGDRGAGTALGGHWTSRPAAHAESEEAVEFFGEATVRRLHEVGNRLTPPVEIDLRPDGRFEARGRLTPDGDESGRAWGRWQAQGAAVRLTVEGSEAAPGLESLLVLRAEGKALTWGAPLPGTPAPVAEDDEDALVLDDGEVYLFRE